MCVGANFQFHAAHERFVFIHSSFICWSPKTETRVWLGDEINLCIFNFFNVFFFDVECRARISMHIVNASHPEFTQEKFFKRQNSDIWVEENCFTFLWMKLDGKNYRKKSLGFMSVFLKVGKCESSLFCIVARRQRSCMTNFFWTSAHERHESYFIILIFTTNFTFWWPSNSCR